MIIGRKGKCGCNHSSGGISTTSNAFSLLLALTAHTAVYHLFKKMHHTKSNLIFVSPPASQNRHLHTFSSAQLRHLNTKVNQDNRFQEVPPGTISRIRQLRINRRPIRGTKQSHMTNNGNWDSLVYVTVTSKIGKETASTIK